MQEESSVAGAGTREPHGCVSCRGGCWMVGARDGAQVLVRDEGGGNSKGETVQRCLAAAS